MARKTIPKSIRFEVFKRDKFTCQYCGASAPDAILEVDHIKPVSKGGTSDLMNLITACRDCNRGKRDKTLSDNTDVKVQKKQLDDMQDRREQLEMMLKWREEMADIIEKQTDSIVRLLCEDDPKSTLTESGRMKIKILIRRFGFDEVYESSMISIARYYKGNLSSWQNAFDKIGGICYNRKKARENDA